MNAAEIEAWLKPHAIAWAEEDGRLEFHGWAQGVATIADVNDGTPGIAYEDGCAMTLPFVRIADDARDLGFSTGRAYTRP